MDLNAKTQKTENINWLAINNFTFQIDKKTFPNSSFTTTRANIPDLTINVAPFNTQFRNIPGHADKVEYADLAITFLVQETMDNYREIHDWMQAQVFQNDDYPEDMKRRDIKLTVMTSHNNPVVEFTFVDAFPIVLSAINLDSTVSEVEYALADVTFAYSYYEYKMM